MHTCRIIFSSKIIQNPFGINNLKKDRHNNNFLQGKKYYICISKLQFFFFINFKDKLTMQRYIYIILNIIFNIFPYLKVLYRNVTNENLRFKVSKIYIFFKYINQLMQRYIN